jgi:hypothetical protein
VSKLEVPVILQQPRVLVLRDHALEARVLLRELLVQRLLPLLGALVLLLQPVELGRCRVLPLDHVLELALRALASLDDVEVELVHVVRLLLSVLRFLVIPVALILIFFVCRLEADVLVLEDLDATSFPRDLLVIKRSALPDEAHGFCAEDV